MAYSKRQLMDLWVRAGGPRDKAGLMASIALAESGGQPGITNRQGSGATGLWQILGNPFPGNPKDPLTNARMAVAKYKTQGLGAWEAYTNGSYRRYLLGGGHAGRANINDPVPLDCSGAVSAVLGIDPRVSGDFEKWGRPGDGGSRGVTIAANPTHVLMKINGHWFGTSRSNPGGGAGWIPQNVISPQYLKNFTLRHSER